MIWAIKIVFFIFIFGYHILKLQKLSLNSYIQIFKSITNMSDKQETSVTCVTAAIACICVPIALALELIGLAIGIADIVIGAKYLHSTCHIDDLAEYLIVAGVLGLICFLLRCCRKHKAGKDNENPNDSKPSGIEWLFILTNVSILIWGMTLVWDTKRMDCPIPLYEYAYYRTSIGIFLGAAILALAVLYCICSVSVVACCDSDSNTSCIIECGSCITCKKPSKPNQQLRANIEQINQMNITLDRIMETILTQQTPLEQHNPGHVTITVDIPRSDSTSTSSIC